MEDYQGFEAYLDELTSITVLLSKHQRREISPCFTIIPSEGAPKQLQTLLFEEHDSFYKYICKSEELIEVGVPYTVTIGDQQHTELKMGAVVRTTQFDDLYAYHGDDLGATYKRESTKFKVWAPTASSVKVKVLAPNSNEAKIYELQRKQRGTWSYTVNGDKEGYLYTYLVCVNNVWREAVDPYAKSVSINGKYGVIFDVLNLLKRQRRMAPIIQPTDAIIYETHVRDFTIHPASLVEEKGTYKGFVERTGTTGLDYVANLGATHIELLPVNDFAGIDEERPLESYNWGYNPIHYFAPEGSYSSDPANPYKRMSELQLMIESIHRRGLRVILDVVFNHVYIKEESSFEKIVPGYYFRYDTYGRPSNGTGVGNDLASERMMMRKFIIDCALYWILVYNIDGLRFDLMGILDIETMNELRRRVDQIDHSILLFGEGWELNTPLPGSRKATIRNASKLNHISFFNDRFRDLVKGSTFNLYDRGYALGQCNRIHEVKNVLLGSIGFEEAKELFIHPMYSVNYVESHDNHTFWDKAVVSNSYESEELLRRRQRLATCMVLLSQGIPFLHSGQEFYRTKQGNGNSYNLPDDINQIDWSQKVLYEKDVSYVKGIISIRKSHGAFRFSNREEVKKHMRFLPTSNELIAYELCHVKNYGKWDTILVVFNNSVSEKCLEFNEKSHWHVLADCQDAQEVSLYKLTTRKVVIQPISCYVFTKE